MKSKSIELILLVSLVGAFAVLSGIETASASPGTIYIRADGSVDPPTAPIQRAGDVYSFSGNIFETIIVEKDNVIVDGNGYLLQGSGSGSGFNLTNRNNVTIRNSQIAHFDYGIQLLESDGNTLTQNTITDNTWAGILISNSSGNLISGNEVVNNVHDGIDLWGLDTQSNTIAGNNVSANGGTGGGDGISIGLLSSYNTIVDNIVSGNSGAGIALGWEWSTGNVIVGNNITSNEWAGIYIAWETESGNIFYHNNMDNALQVFTVQALNSWDNGYPSGGNYWSDYTGLDSDGDGIGDTPYIIDGNNQDNYPFMEPWSPKAHDVAVAELTPSKTLVGKGYTLNIDVTVTNQGIYSQTFDVTVRANNTNIDTQSVTLAGGSSTTLTLTWDTTSFAKGNYNTSAVAAVVPGEIDLVDNALTAEGIVKVVTPGDVNADGVVGIVDAAGVSAHWYPGPPVGPLGFDPNFDINNDGIVGILDAAIVSANWTG